MARTNWVSSFEKPKTNPTAFDPPETTVLSPYLKFGCISPRQFYLELKVIQLGSGLGLGFYLELKAVSNDFLAFNPIRMPLRTTCVRVTSRLFRSLT